MRATDAEVADDARDIPVGAGHARDRGLARRA